MHLQATVQEAEHLHYHNRKLKLCSNVGTNHWTQLILEVIFNQVEEKKVMSSQHGFTKGKSCLTNLIAFYNGMTGWVDKERAMDVVYQGFGHWLP